MVTLTREEAQKLLDGFDRVGWARTEHADILRARLSQPEPEPCFKCSGRGWYTCGASDMRLKCYECKTSKAAPLQREWQNVTDAQLIDEVRNRGFDIRDATIGSKWQGLTDKEVERFEKRDIISVRAIEAKLREKNAP